MFPSYHDDVNCDLALYSAVMIFLRGFGEEILWHQNLFFALHLKANKKPILPSIEPTFKLPLTNENLSDLHDLNYSIRRSLINTSFA